MAHGDALNSALQLHQSGQLVEAARRYREILAHEPNSVAAMFNLGSTLQSLGQLDEAIACFARVIALDAGNAEAHFKLGCILQRLRRWPAAAESYRAAIRLQPNDAIAYNNLGTVFKALFRLDEAVACFAKALEFQPDFAEVLNNLGNVFKLQGRVDEAMICYQRAVGVKPDNAQAHYNRSLVLLAEGEFAEGWREYAWRRACPDFPQRQFDRPLWQGEPLADRTLLVHAEQGLGDTLQFVRYLPIVAQSGGRVLAEVPRALVPLLAQSGFENLVPHGAPLPQYDVHAPLLDLPGILGTNQQNIPRKVPYLSPGPKLVDTWRGRLGELPGFKIGIAWQGSPTHASDRIRSIPLPFFEALAVAGVELVSLQKGPGTEQLPNVARSFRVRDFGDDVDQHAGPFMDTAAIIRSLDLVVSADTAVAHLAGALGAPVWLALALSPDWRWMYERQDSPWYPTMRLFRQTRFNDWRGVFRRMADALGELLARHR